MIIKFLKRILGITALEARIAELEGSHTYIAADVGYHDCTGVVVFRKRPNSTADMVDVYTFPRELSFQEVNRQIMDLARRYGVPRNRLFVDQPMVAQELDRNMKTKRSMRGSYNWED